MFSGMKVYGVYVGGDPYEDPIQYGLFSTAQKARAWIRKSSYNQTRTQMNNPTWKEFRSFRALCKLLMDTMAEYVVEEHDVDPDPLPVHIKETV